MKMAISDMKEGTKCYVHGPINVSNKILEYVFGIIQNSPHQAKKMVFITLDNQDGVIEISTDKVYWPDQYFLDHL